MTPQVTQRLCQRLAVVVVENLDAVRREPPLAKGLQAEIQRLYHWALRFPGSGFDLWRSTGFYHPTRGREGEEGVGIVFSTKEAEETMKRNRRKVLALGLCCMLVLVAFVRCATVEESIRDNPKTVVGAAAGAAGGAILGGVIFKSAGGGVVGGLLGGLAGGLIGNTMETQRQDRLPGCKTITTLRRRGQ